jgi:hypothetical protein
VNIFNPKKEKKKPKKSCLDDSQEKLLVELNINKYMSSHILTIETGSLGIRRTNIIEKKKKKKERKKERKRKRKSVGGDQGNR